MATSTMLAPTSTPAPASTGGCGCSPCADANPSALERTRFFPRQLVGPTDLTQDQVYFREKLKRHNRMLHGWGVVCGACVTQGQGSCEVVVGAGYLLGPWGDEIVIPADVTIDLCKLGSGEQMGCCGGQLDPWCGDTGQGCAAGTAYLAVRYDECLTKPVRAVTGSCGCGCDDAACEYSRVRESYAFKLLYQLPASYTDPLTQPPFSALDPCGGRQKAARPCPPCPTDPWVILADVAINADCSLGAIDCFAHRRYVVSFADFFFVCQQNSFTSGVGNLREQMMMAASAGGATAPARTAAPQEATAPTRAKPARARARGRKK